MSENKMKDLYEVGFEPLQKKEVESFKDRTSLLNAKLDITVTIGSCQKSIKEILSFEEGDILELEKIIDEDLDININDRVIASGESIKIGNKISVRLNSFKNN